MIERGYRDSISKDWDFIINCFDLFPGKSTNYHSGTIQHSDFSDYFTNCVGSEFDGAITVVVEKANLMVPDDPYFPKPSNSAL